MPSSEPPVRDAPLVSEGVCPSGTIDLLYRVRDAIVAAGADASRTHLRPLLHNAEGIYIRQAPSVPIRSYMDGTQDVGAIVEVYVRSRHEEEALATAQWCSDTIRATDLSSENGTYQFTSATEAVGATLQGLPVDGLFTYMVTMRVEITTY